jgi:hypothetical protein
MPNVTWQVNGPNASGKYWYFLTINNKAQPPSEDYDTEIKAYKAATQAATEAKQAKPSTILTKDN